MMAYVAATFRDTGRMPIEQIRTNYDEINYTGSLSNESSESTDLFDLVLN